MDIGGCSSSIVEAVDGGGGGGGGWGEGGDEGVLSVL